MGADGIVVIAGMEGALASLVAGITAAPVVAVPTSAGYGAALEGVTALLAMLSSCAPGLTVVGIDNGFGAACALSRVLP
jgi:NCAIR mutase (PurE)-related protein